MKLCGKCWRLNSGYKPTRHSGKSWRPFRQVRAHAWCEFCGAHTESYHEYVEVSD